LIHSAAEKTCLAQWGFPDEADLNYWAYFFPSKSQWAKGARWLRCDAMVQVAETGTFTQKYLQWKGNAVLGDGFIGRNA
jgi:transposase